MKMLITASEKQIASENISLKFNFQDVRHAMQTIYVMSNVIYHLSVFLKPPLVWLANLVRHGYVSF